MCRFVSPGVELMKSAVDENPATLWQTMIGRLPGEVAGLSPGERQWLLPRLERIAALQEKIHAFFLEAGGADLCSSCNGECCDRGKNHLTLANILPFFLEGRTPPEPDFSRPCPALGDQGCLYGPGRRPFNCVTFLCEQVEDRLDASTREAFYAAERELRQVYLEMDGRYAGSSMRGIFIRAPRLEGRPFLGRL